MIKVFKNLQRIWELAAQRANDTLTTNDRREMQQEVDQLLTEIDRMENTTDFKTMKLLDGSSSVLAATDKLETNFIRNGLRVKDQFGQKVVGLETIAGRLWLILEQPRFRRRIFSR